MFQGAVEPMQVDAPPEENENVEEEQYVVESTTLVCVTQSSANVAIYDEKTYQTYSQY